MEITTHICIVLCEHLLAPETCYYAQDNGASYRGLINFTPEGICGNWSLHFYWRPEMYFDIWYIIHDNTCRNARQSAGRPACFSSKLEEIAADSETYGFGFLTECGVPECGE